MISSRRTIWCTLTLVALVIGALRASSDWRAQAFDAKSDEAAQKRTAPKDGASAAPADKEKDDAAKELFAGKVVLLPEALKRRGIQSKEEMKDQVVLETPTGELWPIVADWRGRAFFQDERLRNRRVELIARRHPGVPYLQVLTIFTFNDKGERQLTDYWCDICSIPMYELKDCECCQGEIRLRFQPRDLPKDVKPADSAVKQKGK